MNSLDTLKHRRGLLKTRLAIAVNPDTKEALRDEIAYLTKQILFAESRDPMEITGDCTQCSMPVLSIDNKCTWCGHTELHKY